VGNEIEKIFSTSLQSFLLEKGLLKKRVLIVGLGNINVTPDALGPYVLDHILVTRHMFEKKKLTGDFSSVAALAPGVMGTTGLETFDIVQSLLKKIDVDYLMVIDALASSSLERVNKTIQMTDTGIRPGSGVGASRKEFSQDTLGIPVIAIGVPTVVDAVTITSGVIDYVIKYISKKSLKTNVEVEEVKAPESIKERMFGEVGLLDEQEKQALLREALSPTGINMMVTPKEIDEDVEELARLMASSINGVLHPSLRA
jgi:spore protease